MKQPQVVNASKLAAWLVGTLGVAFGGIPALAQPDEVARGVVFSDLNSNGIRDPGEPGLNRVGVSNGVEIVLTDDDGRYDIPISSRGVVFVIKPTGYRSDIDTEQMLPRFYYLHRPDGSPPWMSVPGVPPTGPLPDSIDFPMYPATEPERFSIIVFGDPQPRNLLEVDYLRRDLIEPMIAERVGDRASFGVSLGDLTFDNLHLFEAQNRVIARLGVPWINVIGNHDINPGETNTLDDETFERVYGPPNYAFHWGGVVFLVLDNVFSNGTGWDRRFGDETIAFVRRAVELAPRDALIVAMAHCPLGDAPDDRAMLDALAQSEAGTDRRVLFLTAHWHQHFHEFRGLDEGWIGSTPLHHVVHVTACGNWWGGPLDERGIPEATMSCGAPNGYSLVHFADGAYRMEFRAASSPADYQLDIDFPRSVSLGSLHSTPLRVNVFNGNDRSTVEARLAPAGAADDSTPWTPLARDARERHEWYGSAGNATDISAGDYSLEVRVIDMHGATLLERFPIAVAEDER